MKDELSFNERKQYAKLLYTRHDITNKDIALEVGVEESVIRFWIHEGAWGSVKRSLLISKASQLELLYSQLEKLNNKVNAEENASSKDVDLILKYTTSIKNLESETTVSDI